MDIESLIEFTQRIVRQPSMSGEEGAVTRLVVHEMNALGFDKVWVDKYGSAVGMMRGAQAGKTLLLDAHTDTVGIAPGSVWTRAPFGAEVTDTHMYGRGVMDMKGSLAAMIHATASVDKSKLAGTILISASVMEEVYEGGALKAVMTRLGFDCGPCRLPNRTLTADQQTALFAQLDTLNFDQLVALS
ncbi:MAG: hypothetical protein DCC59_13000 [Chloroflexi bacterium]|nr:MAG: hypothetical protein DCC59_13000 [Chloroflexota bacterium]